MGSVTDLTISGDNDEPIFPVRYYKHYMYCDNCGSFDLNYWLVSEKDNQSTDKDGALKRFINFATALFQSKYESQGVRCGQCQMTYAYGSPFFVDFKENPRNFTMSDIPLPLYTVYQINGEVLGPA